VKFLGILKVALKNIKSNKLRSALTMLGLIIGIASVIVLVGIGSGATTDVTSKVQSLRYRYFNSYNNFFRNKFRI
jgi:putative ABC transport system permease protein